MCEFYFTYFPQNFEVVHWAWFQDKPGTRGSKPACTHIFTVTMKNDQLVFVKFFGFILPRPIFLVHFSVKNSVLSGGRFAPQRTRAMFGDILGCHNWGIRDDAHHLVGRDRGYSQTCYKARGTLHNKIIQPQISVMLKWSDSNVEMFSLSVCVSGFYRNLANIYRIPHPGPFWNVD